METLKMETILFLSPVESDGTLAKNAMEAVTAASNLAKSLGASWTIGLFGANVQAGADQVATCGATKILGVSAAALSDGRYATDVVVAEALVKASGATIVVAPSSSRVARIAGGMAQRLKGRADTHVTDFSVEGGQLSLVRWYYRQRLTGTMTRTQRPWIITVDAGTQAVCTCAAGKATVEAVSVSLPESKTKVTGRRLPSTGAQTIRPDAQLLFVAGAGWCKKQADGTLHVADAEKLIMGFLEKSKASLGSTKSLVDQTGEGATISFMTHLNQVGQTGSTPRHAKGLSTCCHGEEPHVVGWRFVNERRAINMNANCGWAQGKADVLYVADAFAVMAKVNELL
jgi:electron transfer flavoprotein alpha subunit